MEDGETCEKELECHWEQFVTGCEWFLGIRGEDERADS
jgi:hypothetical protein